MGSAKPLIIIGSCRLDSNTSSFVNYLFRETEHSIADLLSYQIAPYSYDGSYPSTDTFNHLVEKILDHELLVFATPVYWYSMSGLMKTMFDRFTDLIRIHKPLGRKLKNKHIFLLAVGSNAALPEGFCIPFINSADYLDMHYQGAIYYSTDESVTAEEKEKMKKSFTGLIQKTQLLLFEK